MAFFRSGIVQTVTTMAPCSVLVARDSMDKRGFFICTDGSSRSMQAVRRAAVLAQVTGEPITLFSVAGSEAGRPAAEEAVANARALLEALQIPVVETKTAIGNPVEEIVERGSLYKAIVVTDEEIREALAETVNVIVDAVRVALERTPPELSADIVDRGIVLTGGGSLLKNLDKRLREETGLPVAMAEDPLSTVVLGAGKMLANFELLRKISLD